MNVDIKAWRKRWLFLINELTSKNLQFESWLDKENRNPHWSYDEFRCCYFDDLVLDDDYKSPLESKLISQEEFQILKTWHNELKNYEPPNEDNNPLEILSDPEWMRIIQLGVQTKLSLSEILPEEERNVLLNEIDYRNLNTARKV